MKYLKLIGLLFLIAVTFSCVTESQDVEKNQFLKFKTSFPDLADKISYKNIQSNIPTKGENSDNKQANLLTFPIMEQNKVIGRYAGTKDERSAFYVDLSNYKNKVTLYNVNNLEDKVTYKMIFDETTNTYKPMNIQTKGGRDGGMPWRYSLCVGACGVEAVAIASVDGPLPIMDVGALVWFGNCTTGCYDKHLK